MYKVKAIQNPYNPVEYSVVNDFQDEYRVLSLDDLADMGNMDELFLLGVCNHLGCSIEFYSFRQDKNVSEQEYIDHFMSYNSDVEYILARVSCTKEQAEKLVLVVNSNAVEG